MNKYIQRWIQLRLEQALQVMPVVVVTGARQTGKSTLARHIDPTRRYLTLDDLDVLDQARRDPLSLLADTPLTIDEVQRAPELLSAIKRCVDTERMAGDYLLTGSAQLSLMQGVSESLAGRAVYLDLNPFCPLEWTQSADAHVLMDSLFAEESPLETWEARDDSGGWMDWLLCGGFPSAVEQTQEAARAIWFSGYVQTYMERDLRALSQISNLPDFQRMMRIAAQRTGRLFNQAEVARDAGLSQASCHRYLNLLEAGCQIARLQPYTANPTTALVKSAKLFWADTGLAAWLAGVSSREDLERRADIGFWLEQAIFQTFQAWRGVDPVRRRISYWRTRSGNEVDFVLEQDHQRVGVEVKMGRRVGLDDTKSLNALSSSLTGNSAMHRGVVLCGADEARRLGDNIVALPYNRLFPSAK